MAQGLSVDPCTKRLIDVSLSEKNIKKKNCFPGWLLGQGVLTRLVPPTLQVQPSQLPPPPTSCTHVLTTEGASCGLYWWESLIPPSKPSAEATFLDKLLRSPRGQPLSPPSRLCWSLPWHSARGAVTHSHTVRPLDCKLLGVTPAPANCSPRSQHSGCAPLGASVRYHCGEPPFPRP